MSQAHILLVHFKTDFLRGLAMRDERVIGSLRRAHCSVLDASTPPLLEFRLPAIFDALCISAQEHGLPTKVSNWDKTFRKFCRLLMTPWPDAEIASSGYGISLSHRGNSLATTSYKLLPRNNSFKPNPLRGSA
jgi:hypothetical protein